MNGHRLAVHYPLLRREERLRATLAAGARGDTAEVIALLSSCPTAPGGIPDPQCFRRLLRVLAEVPNLLSIWSEVSHYVVQNRLLMRACETRGDAAGTYTMKSEWRRCSELWRTVEAALTGFCGENDLTIEQLPGSELLPSIEVARAELHPEGRVDRALKEGITQRLQQAWEDDPSSDEAPEQEN